MAQSKAHEVDRYITRPNAKHRIFLVYGPDTGLVSERVGKLAKASGADLEDPFATIKMDAEDAASDPSRIADEAHTVSMFGGNRLVWIRGSTQKNLANALQPILDLPPTDAIVIIEGGDLKKTSPLRSRIEKNASAMALPCYQDQARAIDGVIDEELQASNLTIQRDAKLLLKSLLGGDRMASRAEVQKLCLYSAGQSEVSEADILAVVGDASALAVDAVVDAASIGDVQTMEHTFKRLIAQGTAVFQVINAAQRHFQSLHMARSTMESKGQPASSAIAAIRPPFNFQRKDTVIRALSIWQLDTLQRVMERLDKTSFETRANSALSVPLASTALLAIAIEARQRNRRR